jgi:hypothetical protein
MHVITSQDELGYIAQNQNLTLRSTFFKPALMEHFQTVSLPNLSTAHNSLLLDIKPIAAHVEKIKMTSVDRELLIHILL